MASLIPQDLRFGWRLLARTPAVSAIAVVTLALGIGANAAIFSLVDGVLLKPLGYPEPESLVALWEHNLPRDNPRNVISPANFLAWHDRSRSFRHLGAVADARLNLTGVENPEELGVQLVSRDLLLALEARPSLGRIFSVEEDTEGASPVVILSHRFWQRHFNGDASVIGQTLELNSTGRPIVGVMPATFRVLGQEPDVWVPMRFGEEHRQFGGRYLAAIGRLDDGVSTTQARAELDDIAQQLQNEFPSRNAGWGISVVPLHDQITGASRTPLLVLLGAVGMLLLIACANVANLLLARASARQREMAIRSSLGAARARLLRQLLAESVLLASLGGALGVVVADGAIRAFLALAPDAAGLPRIDEVGVDARVLGFSAATALLTALVFGVAPALQTSRTDLTTALRDGARGSTANRGARFRGGLVVVEVALAVMLLIGSGLLIRSFAALTDVDPGYRAEGLLTMRLQFPGTKFEADRELVAHQQEILARVAAHPQIERAGSIQFLPIGGLRSASSFYPTDRPEPDAGEHPVADARVIAGDYFEAMQIDLLAGRRFDERDSDESVPVAIVNRRLADSTWPGENPIGKQVAFSWGDWVVLEVVGVVADTRNQGLDFDERPALYRPLQQDAWNTMSLVARTRAEPLSAAPAVIEAIRGLDAAQPVSDVRAMNDVLSESVARQRLNMTMLSIFAALAVLLAALGIYGVIAYSVTLRTHEIGVRVALGATAADVVSMVLLQSLRLGALGSVIGLLGAAGGGRVIESLLFGVSTADPLTFALVPVLLGSIATLASLVPALRGARIDPISALRAN